jgi:WD40 repeat protein
MSEPLSVQRRVEAVCRRFEAAWQAGAAPRLEDYLAAGPGGDCKGLLRELLRLEVYYRGRNGETPAASDYDRRFPADGALVRSVLAENPTSAGAGEVGRPAGRADSEVGVPGYEVLGELGRGGMGVVYRARHLGANRVVALKLIRADRLADLEPAEKQGWLDRFRAEVEAVAHLEHPHIVSLYEVGEACGQPYFTMRLVEGASLAQGAPAALADRVRLLARVARAVHHAHQHGVLHRDLKPGNILLDAEGQPHLTDFGLAQRIDPTPNAPPEAPTEGLAADGPGSSVAGTISYMAPEQARGDGRLTTAADVYALGAVLYELLTGRPPFPLRPGESAVETLYQVLTAAPAPPRRLEPRVPRDLEAACLLCLHKEASRRYGSALALAEDLERWLECRPTHARPCPAWERVWKWRRRQPALAALLGVLVLALLGVAAGVVGHNREVVAHNRELGVALQQTRDRELTARRYLYAADMNLALQDWKDGRDDQALARLLRHQPQEGQEDLRAFEWHYLWRLCGAGRVLRGHTGPVFGVAFSRGGTLATASGDGAVRLWDVAGRQVGLLRGHTGMVVSVAFSPDGKLLATASEDRTVRLWEVDTGKQLDLDRAEAPLGCVAFSPDGKRLAAGDHEGLLHVWEVTGKGLGKRHPAVKAHRNALRCLAFSPTDAGTLATGSLDMTLKVWKLGPAGVLRGPRTLEGHTDELWGLAFSPDGKRLASASADDPVFVWDLASGEQRPLGGENRDFLSVAFSPDGGTLATGGRNGVVRLFEGGALRPLARLVGHTGPVYSLAFSPDGRTLASGGVNGAVRLWDVAKDGRAAVREGAQRVSLGERRRVSSATFSADARRVAVATVLPGGRTEVCVHDAASGRPAFPPAVLPGLVTAVAFSPDGAALALGNEDGAAAVWEPGRAAPAWGKKFGRKVLAVAFAPLGREVAVGCLSGMVFLWDPAGNVVRRRLRHGAPAAAVAFRPDGAVLASGGYDGVVRRWRVADGLPLPALRGEGHRDWVTGLAFAPPDGRTLASTCDDCTIKLWDLPAGRNVATLEGHAGWLGCLAFSPDGQTLATGSDDLTVKLWDRVTGLVRGSLDGPASLPRAVAFTPDGKTLAAVAEDRVLFRWLAE